METIQTEKTQKNTLYEFYEEIEKEMQGCGIEKNTENCFYEIFDNNLFKASENPPDDSPSDDLLRELHTICKEPSIAQKMVEAVEKIAREELANRKEKARLKVIEVYDRIKQAEPQKEVA